MHKRKMKRKGKDKKDRYVIQKGTVCKENLLD